MNTLRDVHKSQPRCPFGCCFARKKSMGFDFWYLEGFFSSIPGKSKARPKWTHATPCKGGSFGRVIWEGHLGGSFIWEGHLRGSFGRVIWEGLEF